MSQHYSSTGSNSSSSHGHYAAWSAVPPKQEYNPALYVLPPHQLRPKPSIAATEIETDFEDDVSEVEEDYYLGRRSEDSTSKRSEATLASFDEVRTPASNNIGFTFQNVSMQQQQQQLHQMPMLRRSKAMEGPVGPSLFRMSQESSANVDVYLSMSPPTSPNEVRFAPAGRPLGAQQPPAGYPSQQQQQQQQQQHQQGHRQPQPQPQLEQQHVFSEAPRTSVPLRTWTPWQVADWMHALGFERAIIEQFYCNDISGITLIDLQYDDLKELGISSFGQRHRLWNEIKTLKDQTLASNFPPTPGQEIRWQQPEPSPPPSQTSSRGPTPPQQCSSDGNGRECSDEQTTRTKKNRRVMRRAIRSDDVISPAESASIVAIEQLLPEPHECDRGEACPKFRRQQRKLKKLATEFPLEYSQIVDGRVSPSNDSGIGQPVSVVVPSVIASSDLLGPAVPKIQLMEASLRDVQSRDPQDNVRTFLNFQHVAPATQSDPDTPGYEMFPPLSPPDNQPRAHANLRSLPKLTIPAGQDGGNEHGGNADALTAKPAGRGQTPMTAYYGQRAPVHDMYRVGSPASEMDVPVTALPLDPLGPNARDVSSSVPPDMRFGGPGDLVQQANPVAQPARREHGPPPAWYNSSGNSGSSYDLAGTRRRSTSQNGFRQRRPSFGMSPLAEVKSPIGVTLPTHAVLPDSMLPGQRETVATNIEDDAEEEEGEDGDLTPGPQHAGYMRKRRTKMLRHEWNESHYRLTGTQLTAHRDQFSRDPLECIDVDDYAVAVAANQSKLNAAMKRLRLNGKDKGDEVWKYGFQLTPASDGRSKIVGGSGVGKTHHFAVSNANDRIDWMRELMLARAKKDKDMQHERFD